MAALAVIIAVVAVFVLRNTILQMAFKRVQAKLHTDYAVALCASSVHFSGLDKVALENLTLQPDSADTLATIKLVSLNISIIDLLTAKIGFDEISVSDAVLTVYDKPERNNFRRIHYKGVRSATNSNGATGYRKMAAGYKNKLVRAFNTAFVMQNVQLLYEDSAGTESILVPDMVYDKEQLTGLLINQTAKDTIELKGAVLARNKQYQFTMERIGTATTYLPMLNRNGKLKCCFKSITTTLGFEESGDELQVNTRVQVKNFHINHWRLATDDVVFSDASFNGLLKVGDETVELDSSSAVTMQNTTAHLFANYHLRPDSVFTLSIHMPETISDTFFNSLPQGMFNTLKGISCTGKLQYDLFFQINTQRPDSLIFTSALNRKDFTIRHYGAENYTRMNGPFTYEAYDKDRFVRNIQVGEDNPAFTPLNRISDYLVKSVMQSEDPSFMLHRGFLPEAFRESIVKNYKERRFARGGSTISMQLVKNVFLSRDKTVSRKAEEALIVYLIENLRLVPKERMLEVYLNVIEWGPNVYGIGEASRFYFNKTPAELTLQESVFLAGIIPRPKYFKYQFDKDGKLKPYLDGYFRILTGRMAMKGWISPADTSGLLPDVKLKGPALRMVVPNDTIVLEPEEEL